MDKLRVEPTIFFIEKISFSLKLFSGHFMGYPSLRLSEVLCIFMNINENIRNKRKMLENLKECTYKITHMSGANFSKLPKLVPNEK